MAGDALTRPAVGITSRCAMADTKTNEDLNAVDTADLKGRLSELRRYL